jgi:predicted dehydrogenase
MKNSHRTRREFLRSSAAGATFMAANPYFFHTPLLGQDTESSEKNDRPVVGCIGTGSRWGAVGPAAMAFGDCVAVCDVDQNHAAKAQEVVKEKQGKDAEIYEDYRSVLDRQDIDVVVIVTPDHWHSKIAIEAMKAGKDVYCEKPLTLTIEEGKQIIQVLNETQRVFQVGTQQRTEMNGRFLTAIALIHAGRLGTVRKVDMAIGGAPQSGPLDTAAPPSHLNWEMWLGQTPLVDYIPRRCHYEFRWWYEYSGGKMTDWGAHHVDIAQWAIGMEDSGPLSVKGVYADHPVPLENGHPTRDNEYNTATRFHVECQFPNDVVMSIYDTTPDFDNGIRFEGDKGNLFVSRGSLRGSAVDEMRENPLPEDALRQLCRGQRPGNHMRNFFECLKTRELPIADVYTHHRAMTTCHLANIAIRLGRPLTWDPETEQIVGDDEANAWQSRPQRKGYEVVT